MAIQNVSPNISILYSNRARCYRELGDFDKVDLELGRAMVMLKGQWSWTIRI